MKKMSIAILVFIGLMSNSNAQFSVSAYGAVSIPTGNFSDYYKTSFGVRGNIFYATSENVQLFLHSGYNVWKFNNDKFNDWFHNTGEIGTFSLEIPNTAIPFLFGSRYSVNYYRHSKVFLEIAAGVYFITSSASGKFTDNTGTYDLGNERKNFTEFTVHAGGGATMALSNNLRLDAGVYFDIITNSEAAKQAKSKSSREYYDSNKVTTILFCIGLNYQL